MMVDNKKEIEDIKRLLMLLLIKSGATSEEIGLALQLESSVVRKMLPISKIKKFKEQDDKKSLNTHSRKTNENSERRK